eukprot:TRINITY_DN19466_c0_g1_i1.p1 TRINITY_DN19466_c0_g1~~TRINITY_DN19466_c0_g1_i1.p1  ORF type:complete len:100 (-),score=6.70 TRINITY_DN19466_c0_g1_i1:211-510(-)
MCCMDAFEAFDFMLLVVFDLVTILNAVSCGFLCVCVCVLVCVERWVSIVLVFGFDLGQMLIWKDVSDRGLWGVLFYATGCFCFVSCFECCVCGLPSACV